jgi:hypothetical protein
MQASKVIPGRTYAVKGKDGKLLRFIASEVVTISRRKSEKANPHDYDSTVTGYWADNPDGLAIVHEGVEQRKTGKLSPDELLGEFTAYEELVARKKAEEDAREAKSEREKQDARDLAMMLYALTWIEPPKKLDDYKGEFRTSYGDITINREGVVALLAALKKREAAA